MCILVILAMVLVTDLVSSRVRAHDPLIAEPSNGRSLMNIQRTPTRRGPIGREYKFPKTPTVVGLHRRLGAGLYRARDRRGAGAEFRAADEDREPDRALGDAELHQPEQPVDHHRPPAGGARHRGQLLLRPRDRQGSDDERRELPARADHHAGVPRRRRQGRGGHRQGQAARAARQGPRHVDRPRDRVLVGEGRQGDRAGQRHRRCARARRHAAAGGLFGRSLRVRDGGGRVDPEDASGRT